MYHVVLVMKGRIVYVGYQYIACTSHPNFEFGKFVLKKGLSLLRGWGSVNVAVMKKCITAVLKATTPMSFKVYFKHSKMHQGVN